MRGTSFVRLKQLIAEYSVDDVGYINVSVTAVFHGNSTLRGASTTAENVRVALEAIDTESVTVFIEGTPHRVIVFFKPELLSPGGLARCMMPT